MTYTHFTLYCSYNGAFPNAEVSRLISRHVDGATITFAKGLWKGEWEHSFQVTILIPGTLQDHAPVFQLAESLRVELQQSEVWIEQYQTEITRVGESQ